MLRRIALAFRSSINIKFIAVFLLCMILPLLIIGTVYSQRIQTMLMDGERGNTSAKIDASMAQLEQVLQEMNDIISALVINDTVSDLLQSDERMPTYDWYQEYKRFVNLLQTVSARGNNSYRVTVISAQDKVYNSGAGYNIFMTLDDPLAQAVVQARGAVVIHNRALDPQDDSGMLSVGKALMDRARLEGIVLVDTPITRLDEIFAIFEKNDTRVYVLAQDDGLLYAREPDGDLPLEERELGYLLREAGDSARIGDTEYLVIDNPNGRSGLSIVVMVSKGFIFKASNELMLQIGVGLGVILLLSIVVMVLLSTRISRGIKQLSREVTRFGHEEREISVQVRGQDEVSQLAHGIEAMSRRILRLLDTVREDEHTKWDLEFRALQSQINPHMIYNTLNTITNLARLQNVPNIEEVSSAFVHLLRTVSNRNDEYVSIQDELECVQAFVTIKQYNQPWDIRCEMEADDAARDCRILKLLLQPLVENAIVHGFTGKLPGGAIHVGVRRRQETIFVEISDDGEGMDADMLHRIVSDQIAPRDGFSNVGIYNTWRRLEIKYGEAASFDIQSRPMGGTTVRIAYPAEEMPPRKADE